MKLPPCDAIEIQLLLLLLDPAKFIGNKQTDSLTNKQTNKHSALYITIDCARRATYASIDVRELLRSDETIRLDRG